VHSTAADPKEVVLAVLARISAAWQERRYDELAGCFDERIVLAAPGFIARLEGRDAVVHSYREFMERVSISQYKESIPTVDVWGDTAVATFHWEMAWDAAGTPNHDAGHDVFVLRHVGQNDWRAVWRTMTLDRQQA
jgi:hypothetical protein